MRTIALTKDELELARSQNNCRAASQKLIDELIAHWETSHGEMCSFWAACREKYGLAPDDTLVINRDNGELSVFTAEESLSKQIVAERERRRAIFAAFGLSAVDGDAHG